MVTLASRRTHQAVGLALTVVTCLAVGPVHAQGGSPWPGEKLPLPLAVKSPDELALKQEAERQYLLFNLLAGGKHAYDAGNYHEAVRKWERLLRLPGLPRETEKSIQPLLADARKLAATQPASKPEAATPVVVVPLPDEAPASPAEPVARKAAPRPTTGGVTGAVSGGGSAGPAAAVLWLRRLDGATPAPKPRRRVVSQKNKLFVPGVLAIPVGSTIDFRNDDDYYHNVFSLSPAARFDTGLYKQGLSHEQTFTKPGPVELLCNIHATMLGYIYVVDSPYYAQPQASGAFRIRGVPPGRYELSAWHPGSTGLVQQTVEIAAGAAESVTVRLPADRSRSAVVPDKYGKPRQLQLGY